MFRQCVTPECGSAHGLRLSAVVFVFFLSACVSPPPGSVASLPFEVPGAWSATESSQSPGVSAAAVWWSRFDDPLLGRLVSEALLSNTSISSARAALRQARALRDVAAAGLQPVLGSSASAQRGKSGGNRAANTFNVGLDASWELDVFGANRSALASSEALAGASAATLGDVQVSIAAEVAIGYIALRGAQARLAIAQNNLASQLDTLQITQWRLQAGLTTSLEAEQARAQAEQTRAQLPVLQTSIAQGSHALAVLTGQPPAALSALLAAVGAVPQASGLLALDFPAETLRRRPDVRAAEYKVSSASALVAQAHAARAPDFRLGGSLGLNALRLASLGNGRAVVTSLLASVSLPLFDGGAARAKITAQQAALDQAQSAYAATVLAALKDVEDALVALRNDRDRLSSLQRAADAAANAALLASQRYASGLIDFQTVLETQRTRLGTQDSVVGASADVSTGHVRLYKALGGGWEPSSVVASTPLQ